MKRIIVVVAGFLLSVPLTLAGVAWAATPTAAAAAGLGTAACYVTSTLMQPVHLPAR